MAFGLLKGVRDINRLNQIILVLFEGGFGYLLNKIKLGHKVPLRKKLKLRLATDKLKPEARVRLILEKLGPTFVKFGQLMSVRPDLIPKKYIREFEKLQDDVEPVPFKEIGKIIEDEFGQPINKIFRSFGKEPIASASVSQVHKAVLKNGKKVAVKVQRPKIKNVIETDIEIMGVIAELIQKHSPELAKFNPVGIVNEFAQWTEKEFDFKSEARNAKRFYKNFKGSRTVFIPKVYEEYSTGKILTLEFIDALDIRNLVEIKKRKLNLDKVIKNGFDAILTQVFIHGFFHADPHPGNILVLSNSRISFVDFGIVGRFNDDLKRKSIDLCYGIIEQDSERIVDVFLEMSNIKDGEVNKDEFRERVKDVIEPLQGSELEDIKLSHILEEILDIALKYKVKIPIDFVLFGKTIITLEGIALEYDPKFNIVTNIKPFIGKLIKRRLSPKKVAKDFFRSAIKFKGLLERLPGETEEVLKKLKDGTVKVDVEDTDIKRLSLEIDKSSNRLVYGMIIAALLVASALTIQVSGPTFLGLPMVSFITFVSAMTLLFIFFVSVLRGEKI